LTVTIICQMHSTNCPELPFAKAHAHEEAGPAQHSNPAYNLLNVHRISAKPIALHSLRVPQGDCRRCTQPSCAHSHQGKASWPSCCKAASSWVSFFSHTNQTHRKAFADTAGMSRCQSIRRYVAAIAHLRGARPVTATTLSGMPLQWRTAAASYLQDTKNGSNTKNQQLTHAQYCSH